MASLLSRSASPSCFDALQARLHPAESRVRKLATEAPAILILFDLLALEDERFIAAPLSKRRMVLESFCGEIGRKHRFPLSLSTGERAEAQRWLDHPGGALDGVIAKRRDDLYRPGERTMLKVKRLRSADCVGGGFRYESGRRQVGSLLLGLYDDDGKLHHVGFTSAIRDEDRPELTRELEALVAPPGFTGRAPGAPSRWSSERSSQWRPLRPERVVEVRYDKVTDGRFRHGTAFLRWRPDKAPRQMHFHPAR